jgi:hypothetical protein
MPSFHSWTIYDRGQGRVPSAKARFVPKTGPEAKYSIDPFVRHHPQKNNNRQCVWAPFKYINFSQLDYIIYDKSLGKAFSTKTTICAWLDIDPPVIGTVLKRVSWASGHQTCPFNHHHFWTIYDGGLGRTLAPRQSTRQPLGGN